MKISKNIRILIIITLACCILAAFCSCGGDNDSNNGNSGDGVGGDNNSDVQNGNADMTLRENTPDSLPEDLNFNGAEIRIMHREEWEVWVEEISVESENGEIVNDAIYRRNRDVEERLNVKIVPRPNPGGYPWEGDTFNNTIRNSVLSGGDDFDLIAGYAYYIPVLASEGLLYNWNSVNYINPGEPWWHAGYNDQMTIDGKLYFITGDLAITTLKNMFVFYFNKTLAQEFELENLYQVAFSGDFTIDKIAEIIKDTYKDLNGNGRADKDDMYGFATTTGNYVDAFYNAFDQPIIRKDRDNTPQLVLNSQKMSDIVDKIYGFYYENANTYAIDEYNSGNEIMDMFTENRTLFMPGTLNNNEELRAMDSDYGILPYPKWNKEQPAYYTTAQNSYSLFSIPAMCNRIDAVGATVEALCAESYRKVTPAYYEIALKQKYSRDEESSQMLDLIRAGMTFDFGVLNSISLDRVQDIFRLIITDKSRDFASRYERGADRYQELLNKLIEEYEKLP